MKGRPPAPDMSSSMAMAQPTARFPFRSALSPHAVHQLQVGHAVGLESVVGDERHAVASRHPCAGPWNDRAPDAARVTDALRFLHRVASVFGSLRFADQHLPAARTMLAHWKPCPGWSAPSGKSPASAPGSDEALLPGGRLRAVPSIMRSTSNSIWAFVIRISNAGVSCLPGSILRNTAALLF